MSKLTWVDEVQKHRAGSTRLGDVTVSQDLMGLVVVVAASGSPSPAATVHLSYHDSRLAEAVACRLRGLAAAAGSVRDLDTVHLRTDPAAVAELIDSQRAELLTLVAQNRLQRAMIDSALEDSLGAPQT